MAQILIVDDEQHNRLLLVTVLGSVGHVVLEAKNGADAIGIARKYCPALIIIDLSLPDMSGTQLVQMLRADPELADVRLALYTASSVSAAMVDFMEMTCIRFVIPKPSEPEEILRVVRAALD